MLRGRERQAEALRLRNAGYGYVEIARRLGYHDRQAAYRAAGRARARGDLAGCSDDDLVTGLARVDRMQIGVWPAARSGDLQAVDRVLALGDRRQAIMDELERRNPPPPAETPLDQFMTALAERETAADLAITRARRCPGPD